MIKEVKIIKMFCDLCGKELTKDNCKLDGSVITKVNIVDEFETIWGTSKSSYHEVCDDCINTINKTCNELMKKNKGNI